MKVLAIDIGGTAVKSGIVDEHGNLTEERKAVYDLPVTRDAVLCSLYKIVDGYSDYDGIGVSTTGAVNPDGSIGYASGNIQGFGGTPLKQLLEERSGKRVSVMRDTEAMAWGEIAYGAGKDFSDFLCVIFGSGVGGALVIDRKPYGGACGGAGHIGHITIHAQGKVCQCGLRGCYEAYASAKALTERAYEKFGIAYSGVEIFEKLHLGNQEMQKLVEDWVDDVCAGLASLAHTLSPACIVLGGGVMEQDTVVDFIKSRLYNLVVDASRHFEIRKAASGNATNLLGAAYGLYQ